MTDLEKEEIQRLKNSPITESDHNMIFMLYKKYVKDIWNYTTGCNCDNGIEKLYKELMEKHG